MGSNIPKKVGCVVVGYLVLYSAVHYYLFGSRPSLDTQWLGQAWQMMGPSGAEE